jgi:hypothetical protein
MVEGFLTSSTDEKLIIVGNFLDSRYQSEIHALNTHYRGCDRLTFTGALYGTDALSCFANIALRTSTANHQEVPIRRCWKP